MVSKITSLAGFIIIIVSLFFCCTSVYDLTVKGSSDTDPGVLTGLAIFFTATLAGGIFIMIKAGKARRRNSFEKKEKQILEMIAIKDGRITPEEIALDTIMTVKDARMHLERLCENGSGQVEVTESGRLVYVFFGFISCEEKKSSQSALHI